MADNAPAAPVTAAPAAPAANAPVAPAKTAENVETPATKVDENGVAADAPKKIYKLNVGGKEVAYDASNEEKLKADLQKVFGIEEKARSTAQKVDQADKLLSMLQSDPTGFAKQCKLQGIDATKLATEILYNQMRLQSMTPEQRELEEYKEREAEAKATKEAQEAEAKIADANKKTQDWAKKFETDCETALKANSIPKTRLSIALIAQYIDAGLMNKQELTVEQVLPYVARDLKQIHMETIGKLDGDELLAYVGEELSNKIAKARVARYNRKLANPAPEQKTVTGRSTPVNEQKRLDDILKKKGPRAYWAEVRRVKSEAGIGLHPGAPGNP